MRKAHLRRGLAGLWAKLALPALVAALICLPAAAMVSPRLKPPAPHPAYASRDEYARLNEVRAAIAQRNWAGARAAADKLAELFREVDDGDIEAVRIFVTGGGCGGMSYGMTFTDSRNEHDAVLEGEGYKVYVDAVALNFLRGVEIDFVDRGMGQASFVFNNVFAAVGGSGGCSACGSSGGGCG